MISFKQLSLASIFSYVLLLLNLLYPAAALPAPAAATTNVGPQVINTAPFVALTPSATPISVNNNKPDFPSHQDCEKAIKDGQPPKDQSIFFTGLQRKAMNDVKSYAESHGLTHVTNQAKGHQIWNPATFTNVGDYKGTDEQKTQFQKDFSAVYAEKTSGKAYLMMDLNTKPKSTSIFYSVEFPAMKASGNVDEIIWLDINAKPDDPTKITKTWWKKGEKDPPTDSATGGDDVQE